MTPRQSDLLVFIKRYQADNAGVPPSYAEMAIGIGLSAKSKATVSEMLDALEADGLIARKAGRVRCITVLPQRADLSAISDDDIAAEFRRRFVQEGIAA